MHPMSDISFLYLFVQVYHIVMKLYIFQVALTDRLFDEILLLLAFVSYLKEHTIASLMNCTCFAVELCLLHYGWFVSGLRKC